MLKVLKGGATTMGKRKAILFAVFSLALAVSLIASACTGEQGPPGSPGSEGRQGSQGPPGSKPSAEEIKALIAEQLREAPATAASIARGGRLYDNWVKETQATAPSGNQPLWELQKTNTR